jgi:hypothetical protein
MGKRGINTAPMHLALWQFSEEGCGRYRKKNIENNYTPQFITHVTIYTVLPNASYF